MINGTRTLLAIACLSAFTLSVQAQEACDAQHFGGMRYRANLFEFCDNGGSWKTFSQMSAGASTDRITSSTTSAVIANTAGGTISFTLASTVGAAYLHGTLGLVAPGVSTTTGNVSALRILTSTADSAALPSHSWVGDPDTGLFWPAANTIGFSTGSSEVMRITSAGLVGIGTAAPKATLDVSGSISLGTGSLLMPYKVGPDSLATSYAKVMAASGNADSSLLINTDATDVGLSNQETVLMVADAQTNDDDGFSVVVWNANGFSRVPLRVRGTGNIGMGGMLAPAYPLDVSGTVRATKFLGDGSSLTNLSGDNLGNHTAIQALAMGTNTIGFGNTIADKIYLYSNSYGIGIESGNLTNWGTAFRWRIGGTSASTGSQQMALTLTGLNVSGSLSVNNDDLVTAPGFTWNGDTNTGLYWVAADQFGLATGGVQRTLVNSAGLTVTGRVSTTGLIDAGGAIYGYAGDSAAAPGYTWSGDTNTGMYNAAPDVIGLSAGGAERFRVTTAGISTTGNISLNTGGSIFGDNGDTSYTGTLSMIAGSNANTGSQITLYGIDNAIGGRIYMYATSDTTGALLYRFYSRTTAGTNSTILSLYQGGNAALTGDMTASSFIGDGSALTNIGSAAIANGSIAAADINPNINLTVNTITVSGMAESRGDTPVCTIYAGATYGRLYTTSNSSGCNVWSDARLKKDVVTISPSLEKLLKLRPVTFHWKDPSRTTELQMGFIAQEANTVLPEIVTKPDKDHPYWGMYYNALIPYLVRGVQDLKAIIDNHDTEIATLKSENAALKQRLGALENKVNAR